MYIQTAKEVNNKLKL